MSNNQNGKNGHERELDRLLKLIEQIARIDEKLGVFCDEVDKLRKEHDALVADLNKLLVEFTKLKASYDKTKWIWGAIAFIVVPLISFLVIKLLDIICHLPL